MPLYWHNGWKPKPWRWGQSKKPFQERHDEQGRPAGTGVILGQYEWTGDGKDGSVQRRLTTVLLREDRADGSPIAPMGNFSSTFGAWQLHPGYRYDYSTRSVQLRYGPIPDLLDQRAPR
ncbi:hypothetical protein [Geodermatophilus obscurus]|uniref:hypothetical protein n=1 Tax=Geodermatophilus obscurus TaxID=1861 RepID=UPI00116049E6|nr:hypothetical protein [Geodermatophilus obscurus]